MCKDFNCYFFKIDKKGIPAFAPMPESAFCPSMLFHQYSVAKIAFIFGTSNFWRIKKIKTTFIILPCFKITWLFSPDTFANKIPGSRNPALPACVKKSFKPLTFDCTAMTNSHWRNYRCLLRLTLTVCYIPDAFSYGFHLLPTRLQETPFYGVKGHLLQCKKPSLGGRKGITWNRNHHRTIKKNNSADGLTVVLTQIGRLNLIDFHKPVSFSKQPGVPTSVFFIECKDCKHIQP